MHNAKRRVVAITAVPMILICFAGTSALAQLANYDGGLASTDLGDGIAVNKGTSLHRRWAVVNDPNMPLSLVGAAGIVPAYLGERGYEGTAKVTLSASEPLVAYEIRFVLIDVWGDVLRTYNAETITDVAAGQFTDAPQWTMYNEKEVGYVYSIAYVSRVMTARGRIVLANDDAIIDQARKIASGIKKEDLTPKPPPR